LNETEVELTREEIEAELKQLAFEYMGCAPNLALVRIMDGEFEGTLLANKIVRLFAMLGEQ
jgi:hypothetical protein